MLMRRWILVLVAGVVVFAILGFVLTFVPKLRRAANEATVPPSLRRGIVAAFAWQTVVRVNPLPARALAPRPRRSQYCRYPLT